MAKLRDMKFALTLRETSDKLKKKNWKELTPSSVFNDDYILNIEEEN
jgi:hypothetical protein